jgi:hypothetical protein
MAVVFAQGIPTIRGWTVRRVAARLHRALNLTSEERANLYVSRMPIAVVTASLGGHPIGNAANR